LIEIGSKTAEKNSAQTNRQTGRHYQNNGHLAVNQLFTKKSLTECKHVNTRQQQFKEHKSNVNTVNCISFTSVEICCTINCEKFESRLIELHGRVSVSHFTSQNA